MADAHALAHELIERARDDERAAKALLSAGEVSDEIVGVRRSASEREKSLKAALAADAPAR